MTFEPASILGDKNSTKIERTCAKKLDKVDKDELMAKCQGLNREMKEKGGGNISRCIHQRNGVIRSGGNSIGEEAFALHFMGNTVGPERNVLEEGGTP
jgi:hypothetical protein